MSKFRMIRNGLWLDRDFLSVGPEAKLIYLFLMSGQSSTNINGLSITPIDRVCIGCGYPIDRVSIGYQELKSKGLMLHDEEFDVVFLPREILENPPGSWQQMDGYMKTLEEFPDCFIRNELFEILKDVAESSKNEKMLGVYRYGIDRVSIGYRYKYKEKYKEKIKVKEEEKVKVENTLREAKTENTEKQELQLLPNPASPPSVIDCVADVKKKSVKPVKSPEEHQKQEEQIYWIKTRYEQCYTEKFSLEDKDDLPPWGVIERNACKRLISGTSTVDRILTLIPDYFRWANKQVIDAGYPFAAGYASFCQKINELIADIADPGRRNISQILAFKEQTAKVELKAESEREKYRAALEESMELARQREMQKNIQ